MSAGAIFLFMETAPLPPEELACRVAFCCLEFVGSSTFGRLMGYFGSAQKAWQNLDRSNGEKLGIGEDSLQKFLAWRSKCSPMALMDKFSRQVDYIFPIENNLYSSNLKNISDPPYLLFVRGNPSVLNGETLAVVGSRRISPYGRQAVEILICDLVRAGLVIVSGLAIGADACAHQAALDAGGRTLAILASGVDQITPSANYQLGCRILSSGQGAILSERPPGWRVQKFSFPLRNRLIAGVSLGVLVVEAAENSGSLHTVASALEQGREVFAVPGPINSPVSQGTNRLIQQGAKLVAKASDVLEELGMASPPELDEPGSLSSTLSLSPDEDQFLKIIRGNQGSSSGQLAIIAAIPADRLNGILTLLELKGVISCQSGCWFCR